VARRRLDRGAFEVAVIFYLIGHTVSWRKAWFIGAMAQLAAVVGVVGAAGLVFMKGAIIWPRRRSGLPPALGITVALIRRVRENLLDCVGLLDFWRLSKTKPEPLGA